MVISSKHKLSSLADLCLQIEEKYIENIHSYKLLGIEVDENMNWDIHVNRVCKIISSKITLLNID